MASLTEPQQLQCRVCARSSFWVCPANSIEDTTEGHMIIGLEDWWAHALPGLWLAPPMEISWQLLPGGGELLG